MELDMRLRNDRRQNHPAKKKPPEKPVVPQDDLSFLKGGLVEKSPEFERGVPVPKRWRRHFQKKLEPSYTNDQVDNAKRMLKEVSLADWPGPVTLDETQYGWVDKKPIQFNHWRLHKVYRVKQDESSFYETLARVKNLGYSPNLTRLYHGTSETSITGIVLKGLLQGTRGLFGGGIYLAPSIIKASHYTGHDVKYIFEVEAILGNVKKAEKPQDCSGDEIWFEGYHSVGGDAGVTTTYGTATLQRSEYCVYYRSQVRVLFLACYVLIPPKTAPRKSP
jgi:hypothetical protein